MAKQSTFWLLSIVALLNAQNPALDANKIRELDRLMSVQIAEQTTPFADQTVVRYVQRIAQQLEPGLPPQGFEYTIHVVQQAYSSSLNPTREPEALPYGSVFVNTGLILAAEDEAEFTGMLAHAMAHSAARHLLTDPNTPIPVVFFGGLAGTVPLSVEPLRRKQEIAADRLAAMALASAGYDPSALLSYLTRTLPSSEASNERLDSLRQAVSEISTSRTQLIVNSGEFLQTQAAVKIPFPAPPRPSLYK